MRESEEPQYFVYMMTNKNKTVLYTGVTNSLERRVWQHKTKALPGFTKKYNCDRLIYFEIYGRIESAIAREKEIKGWTRAKKNALIFPKNPRWEDIAEKWGSAQSNGSFAVYAAQDDREGTAAQDDRQSDAAQDDSESAAQDEREGTP